jgi:hypothetical protein
MPSPESPLAGSCACGTVRFEVTVPFRSAGHCHCTRCQRRTGALWSTNGVVAASGFAVTAGSEAVRTWTPATGGNPKSFCAECGGHVYAGDPSAEDGSVGVRLGALHGDPGIRPRWRQWLSSAPAWADVPDDGLPRFAELRDID